MLDFDQIVRNTLWEMQSVGLPSTSTENSQQGADDATEEQQTKQDTTNIYTWLTTGSPVPHNELKILWESSFIKKGYVFCSEQELNNLVHAVVSFKPRSTKNPESFVNLESVYPLLDLIANLYEYCFKGNKTPDSNKAKEIYEDFKKRLQKQISDNKENIKPFDYNALDGWTQTVKSAALGTSKGELGKLRLDTMQDNSVYQIVYKICELRKKSMIPALPKSIIQLSGQGIIDKIMLEPWNIVSGKLAINDEKLRTLYDQISVNKMVSLSLAAYKLYQQQLETITGKTKDDSLYEKFVGSNEASKPFGWLNPTSAGADTDPERRGIVSSSFDQTLELMYKEIITEETTPTRKPFETTPGSNMYVYSYKTLKEASSTFKLDEATNLLKELQTFADYIKTEKGSDRLSYVNQIAGALSLGVKT